MPSSAMTTTTTTTTTTITEVAVEPPLPLPLSLPLLQPGEQRPDLSIQLTVASARQINYVAQLSPSFGLFALWMPTMMTLTQMPSSSSSPSSSSCDGDGVVFVDCVLKKADGWSTDDISSILSLLQEMKREQQQQQQQEDGSDHDDDDHRPRRNKILGSIEVEGFFERMRARHANETSPTFVHARRIYIRDSNGTTMEYQIVASSCQGGRKQKGEDHESLQESSLSMAPSTPSMIEPNIHVNNGDANKMNHNNDLRPSGNTTTATTTTTSTSSTSSRSSTQRGAKDYSRFARLVAFLLQEFGGYETISRQPVLDVAGGAGGLAFELSVRHAIDCIVVDTKPVRFNTRQQRHLDFRRRCVDALSDHNGKSPLAENLVHRFSVAGVAMAGTVRPSSLDPKNNERTRTNDMSSSSSSSSSAQLRQLNTLLDANDVLQQQHQHEDESNNNNGSNNNDDRSRLSSLLRQRKCSVMVGMHPDEATDHIIDIGLAVSIPWVVVPCCVFPNFFRNRQTSTGKPVRSYDDLCDYILTRDVNIKETTLPFRGRNRAFYWHPPTSTCDNANN